MQEVLNIVSHTHTPVRVTAAQVTTIMSANVLSSTARSFLDRLADRDSRTVQF